MDVHAVEDLGRLLRDEGYAFQAPTPVTQARVLSRPTQGQMTLRDIFGWNRSFEAQDLPYAYQPFLKNGALFAREDDGRLRARLRFSTLGPLLMAHSGFPTAETDAVFFGPDTYRFAHALRAFADREPDFAPRSCVDVGTGSGAGGLYCAGLFPSLAEIALLDINDRALVFAAANTALNGIDQAVPRYSDILSGYQGMGDLIISNPPYLVDPDLRAYRHGGGDWGASLSLAILDQALSHLSAHGHLLLYTGSAVVNGVDKFLEAALPLLESRTLEYRYEEIDPDVFGEELEKWPYDRAERIATVMLHVRGSNLRR